MKIFSTSQVRSLDAYTIEHEPVASIDLMERAAQAIFEAYANSFNLQRPVLIVAGPGNNGGDALALARILVWVKSDVRVLLLHNGKLSADCETNLQRLRNLKAEIITEITDSFAFSNVNKETVIVDGIFGSGLSRPAEGIFAEAIDHINRSGCEVLSIDVPSGLLGELNPDTSVPIVKATRTFTLQFPKLAFLLPETGNFAGNWSVLDIGIHPEAISQTETRYFFIKKKDIQPKIKIREKFSHKGTYGHVLIFAGSRDMAGAAVLSSEAALRSGAGLVTVHSASCNRIILQTAVPEVIFESDNNEHCISEFRDLTKFNAIAIGPGIGQTGETSFFLKSILSAYSNPIVLDADALNLIAANDLLQLIPENSILTPHPKEFERLFGKNTNSFERLQKASTIAQTHKIIIILKGAHTQIFMPDGKIYFNSTGNAGMATAGSGDVLTGIMVGLLAQGYQPQDAALTGVFLHGLAADLITETEETMLASDIIRGLKLAFRTLR
ncbi:MAG: NAD(P)H-hydrate dehydratase [Paludibacter sp.]|jgi:NAD(P)H-hydrate epimerase|nr:NAD(P)H-hydrate dehydratase [Paludibacter sp.]